MPILHAVVSCPAHSVYKVMFRYLEDGKGRELHDMPHIELPAKSYEHAQAIADAFNAKD